MKIKKFLFTVLSVVVLILELLPNGVVLRFGNPEGKPWIRTYNYFSLTPFGYANFGPFITALLTCVLLVLAVIYLFKQGKGLNAAIMVLSGIAAVTSLMPLMFGVEYITVIGVIITLLMVGTFGVCFIKHRKV